MKCIAAVILALAAVAQASYLPYQGYAVAPVVTYAAGHYGPTVVQSNDYHQGWAHAPAVVSAYNNHWNPVPAAVAYDNGHYYGNYHGYSGAAVIAAPVQHSASYVAANRGAVHKAPLVGHAVNQKSLNLAPAPGTW